MNSQDILAPCGEGIAVENRQVGDNSLCVLPVTTSSYLSGEATAEPTVLVASGVDAQGQPYTDTVSLGVFIEAQWYRGTSETAEPPWVRRGERVRLFRVGDSLDYVWQSLNMDTGLRRLETKTFLSSATTDESVRELTPENSYVMQLSAHEKRIVAQTSTENGEPTPLMLHMDAAEGTLSLGDGDGNQMQIINDGGVIKISNSAGSCIELSGDTITIRCRNFRVESDVHDVKATHITHTATTWSVGGAKSMSVNAKNISLSGKLTNNGQNVGSSHRHRLGNQTTQPPQ